LGLLAATMVFILHGMVDVDLRYPPNQPLLWMLLGLLVSGSDRAPITLRLWSRAGRSLVAVACYLIAAVVTVGSVAMPMWADIWERKARAAEAQSDLAGVVQAAGRALEIQPFRLGTRYFLAGVLARIPTDEARVQAIEQCRRIEELAPDYGDITFNLGQVYLAAGQPAAALPYLRRAVVINPYNTQKRAVLDWALAEFKRRTKS
jgi:tetratricopeptide (TPR) repeat protein